MLPRYGAVAQPGQGPGLGPGPRSVPVTRGEQLAPYVCEFLGTFILTFVASCCASLADSTWSPTAIAAVLVALIYGVGHVSGGHLNPAVSLALSFAGKLRWRVTITYIVVQIVGGLSGGFLGLFLAPPSTSAAAKDQYPWGCALFVEMVYTFMLCFVVLNACASERNNPKHDRNQFYALAIGFVIIAGGYAGSDISSYFNPAVAIGVGVAKWSHGAHWGPFCVLYELAGSVLAGVLFVLFRREDYRSLDADALERYSPGIVVRAASELVGSFMLALTVCLNVVSGHTATAWSAAATLMSMIYALGNVSGGHFNPAVTLSVVLSGRNKCKKADGVVYVLAQLVGGALAALGASMVQQAGPFSEREFGLKPAVGSSWVAACVGEFLFTFLLGYVVLCVATVALPVTDASASKQNFFFALAIGSCVTAGGCSLGSISGGSLNPAVSLGLALEAHMMEGQKDQSISTTSTTTPHASHFQASMANFLIYTLAELGGGAFAALVFLATHTREYIQLPVVAKPM